MFGSKKDKNGKQPMGQQKAKQNPNNETDLFADEKERKDEIELTAWKKALKNTQKWKVLIILFICTGLVAPMISVRAINTLNEMGSYLTEKYKEISGDKPGKQVALQAVYSWLDDDKGAFQYGYANLWWNGATEVSTSTSDDSNGSTTQYWSHQMSLTDKSDGSTRDITQLVAVTDGVATAVGTPTVLPKTDTSNSNTDTYRPDDYIQLDQNTSLTNVVSAWSKAYIGKDSNALTVLVGDPNSDHMYQPASLGSYLNSSLDWLVQCTKDGKTVDKQNKSDNPEWAAASVSISFKPYEKKVDASTANDPNADTGSTSDVETSVTVLIHNPTRGSAKIVDWGAEGSLTTLKAFSNAIDRSLIGSSSSDDDDDSSDSSSSDSDSGSGDDGSDNDDSDSSDSDSSDNNGSSSSQNSDDGSVTGDPNEGPND